jgi:hypothetical protein
MTGETKREEASSELDINEERFEVDVNSISTDGCGFCRSTLSLKTNKRKMALFKKEKGGSRCCYSIGEFSHSNSVAQFGELRARKGFGQYIGEFIFSGMYFISILPSLTFWRV